MIHKIEGKRVHIAGSIPQNSNLKTAEYCHSLVRKIAGTVLSNGGGIVVTLGLEPYIGETKISTIFDWSILEVIDQFNGYPNEKWPKSQGMPVVAVAFEKYTSKIPEHRQKLWQSILANNRVELQLVPAELSVGGIMRQEQSKFGDILLTFGGHLGVYHLSQLYQSSKKPVIPINLPFVDEKPTASENLSHHANREPKELFDYKPQANSITAYSKLSLKNKLLNEESFCQYLLDFIDHLPAPLVFYVRLLDRKNPDFSKVEQFFRKVVDKVIVKMGYQRFEMETDFSENIFMNVELFQKLHESSLVIADLTGVRPNCCLELGFALGSGKKFILTAEDGTMIPWDTTAIHCHFWKTNMENKKRQSILKEFLKKNINKNPLY
jgi:hypothetical protein